MNAQQVHAFFSALAQANAHPQTELIFHSHFELLIAVMLSAQSTDVAVNRVTQRLFAIANTPQTLLAMNLTDLEQHLKTLGLYRSKALHVQQTCQRLIEHFDGQVPPTRADLESLSGVGRKTANVVLNCAFGQPTMAVDTHVFRVSNRTGLALGNTPRQVEDQLLQRIPSEFMQHAHHWLILHGRYVCQARKPQCSACQVSSLCQYQAKSNT